MDEKQLTASVASVLGLVASEGLNGDAEIRCRIKGRKSDVKATVRVSSHSSPQSYSTWIKHLEVEFDDDYIDQLVQDRVASIFAGLAVAACKPTAE